VEAYARVGFDVLTYATVRSVARAAYPLPNIIPAESRDEVVVARRAAEVAEPTLLALSTGSPSQEPDVWRKDVRRAKDRLGTGQILIVSVIGTPAPGGSVEALAADYAQCASWAVESGADAIEVHLAWPRPEASDGRMVYDDLRLSTYLLDRVRAAVQVPIVAKLGGFRSARTLHDTLTKLAPWVHGFELVHGIRRRLVDESGNPVFEDKDRAVARVIGPDVFPLSFRQVEEAIAWRKAGAWQRALLALGGITTVEQVRSTLRAGAEVAMVDTAALVDPLFAVRLRGTLATAA
jgi:dihydroorotate dehydrogenase